MVYTATEIRSIVRESNEFRTIAESVGLTDSAKVAGLMTLRIMARERAQKRG